MGLLDGYFDPDQFPESGGLLSRLIALQKEQGQYQPGGGFEQPPSVPPQAPVPAWPNFASGGQTSSGLPIALPDLSSQNQALANQQRPSNMPAPGSVTNGISAALTDFYYRSILQAGKDIAGYASDAMNDPVEFTRAAAPSLAGLGPIAGQLPAIIKGTLGASKIWQPTSTQSNLQYPSEVPPRDPGDKAPSTPIGKRGGELNVVPGTNLPANIGGRSYTGHAADQMQARGIPPSAVEDAIQNGRATPGNQPNTTLHIGINGVKVVTGSNGQVITVIPGKP